MRFIALVVLFLLGHSLVAAPAYSGEDGPQVTIVTIDGCEACPRVIADMRPWLSPHWRVKIAKVQPEPGRVYPYFRFCDGDRCWSPIMPMRGVAITRAWLREQMLRVIR
jgi:hypothetical protein